MTTPTPTTTANCDPKETAMGQIRRMHYGTAKVPAQLLNDIDWVLAMDIAEPRAVVKPLADRLRDYNRDLSLDMEVDCTEGVHDFLRVSEVDAAQRLRGWHRLRYGTVTVDVEALCDVRNVFDTLTLEWSDCEGASDGNPFDYQPAELAFVEAQLAKGDICFRCQWCQFLVMRDRIDVLLDAQGFTGNPYYTPCTYDPESAWRERVVAPTAQLAAV